MTSHHINNAKEPSANCNPKAILSDDRTCSKSRNLFASC